MGAIVPKHEIFMDLDRRDQQQIVAAATGEVVKELIYEVHGRDCLSWQGINHICYMMGDVKVEKWIQWERVVMHDRVFWSATVRAVNERYNLASLGTAEVPERMEVYTRDENKQKIPDPSNPTGYKQHLEPDYFCRRKACSMAQRNAKRAVIPEAVLVKWLSYFKDLKAGRKVEPPFRPKAVESDYRVVGEGPPKQPKRQPKAPSPALIPGEVSLKVIEYNLFDAMRIDPQLLEVEEKTDGFIIKPTRQINDEVWYKINGTIEDLGGVWEQRGLLGCWVIRKEPKKEGIA